MAFVEKQGDSLKNLTAESIIESKDDHMMKTLTNFTCAQFRQLFEIVDPPLRAAHFGGSPTKHSVMTMFSITIHWAKYG